MSTLICRCLYVSVLYVCVCVCMYVYVCVCMCTYCMYVYVLYVCVCIMSVSVLYLYVWPRFSFNTPQSPWKASWRGGNNQAGLSTPRGMCPYHFSGIWGRGPGVGTDFGAPALDTRVGGGLSTSVSRRIRLLWANEVRRPRQKPLLKRTG